MSVEEFTLVQVSSWNFLVGFELKSNHSLLEITKNCSNKTHHLVPQLDESRLPFLWSFPLLGSRPVTDSPSLWLNCAKWFLGGGSPRFECASGHVGSPSPLARPRSTGRGNLPYPLKPSLVHHGAPGSTIASALSLCSAASIIEPQRFWRGLPAHQQYINCRRCPSKQLFSSQKD